MGLWRTDFYLHLISARRPDLIIIKIKIKKKRERICKIVDFACPGWPQNKIEKMWKEGKVPRPC